MFGLGQKAWLWTANNPKPLALLGLASEPRMPRTEAIRVFLRFFFPTYLLAALYSPASSALQELTLQQHFQCLTVYKSRKCVGSEPLLFTSPPCHSSLTHYIPHRKKANREYSICYIPWVPEVFFLANVGRNRP